MTTHHPTAPPVDLDNCATEPIHIPGSIQPHGILLALREPDLTVAVASDNVSAWFGIPVGEVIGLPVADVVGPDVAGVLATAARREWGTRLDELVFPTAPHLTASLHRSGGFLIVEIEGSDQGDDTTQVLRETSVAVQAAETVEGIAAITARAVRALTGFDRVMVYRFDAEWNGEVIAEERRADLNTFLGLHYPATDIPAQARELYRRNWLRLIPDISYAPVPLEPPVAAGTSAPLDLSHSTLRSVSPIHVEYLTHMGVSASMSVSLITRGELWGLVACHHYSGAHRPGMAARNAAEFVGQIASARVSEAEEAAVRASTIELSSYADRAAQAVASTTASGLEEALRGHEAEVLALAGADGAIISASGIETVLGQVPPITVLREIEAAWPQGAEVWSTDELSQISASAVGPDAPAGAMAVALSNDRHDHVVWFRPELLRSVDWGGDPHNAKLAREEGDTVRLSPRRSFAKWREDVRGRSTPWSVSEREAAERFGRHLTVALSRRERALAGAADELQRAMLPDALPDVPGWLLDAYYAPAGVDVVGGDWYDAFEPTRDTVAVVVGDVAGHGLKAACEMAQLRNSLRAFLHDDPDPGRALTRLDRMVTDLLPDSIATVVCAVVDLATGTAAVAHAGHPNALLALDADVGLVEVPGDPVLGIGVADRQTQTIDLRPGSALILFSDGIVERRGEDVTLGLDRLRVATSEVLDGVIRHGVARGIVERAMADGGAGGDDVTVLVLHRAH